MSFRETGGKLKHSVHEKLLKSEDFIRLSDHRGSDSRSRRRFGSVEVSRVVDSFLGSVSQSVSQWID